MNVVVVCWGCYYVSHFPIPRSDTEQGANTDEELQENLATKQQSSPYDLEMHMVRSRGGSGPQWQTQGGAEGQVLLLSDTRGRTHKSQHKGVSA